MILLHKLYKPTSTPVLCFKSIYLCLFLCFRSIYLCLFLCFRSIYLNIPGLIVVNVLAALVGLVVYAHYAINKCDPLKARYIRNPNQVRRLQCVLSTLRCITNGNLPRLQIVPYFIVPLVDRSFRISLCLSFVLVDHTVFHCICRSQIVPYFIIDVLNYPGVLGLFLSVLFSGALRFVSTNVCTLAMLLVPSTCCVHVLYYLAHACTMYVAVHILVHELP